MNQDPHKALDQAHDLAKGKGFLGFLTKLFLGKNTMNQWSSTIDQAKGHMKGMDDAARLRATGRPTQARVLQLADTGTLVNFDPVLRLQLEVIPPAGGPNYVTELQTVVSKIAIPRVGDILRIVVDPANPQALAIA